MVPSRKVGSGALAGAIAAILLWVLETFTSADIPAEIAAAFTTIVYFVTSYWVKDNGSSSVSAEPPGGGQVN